MKNLNKKKVTASVDEEKVTKIELTPAKIDETFNEDEKEFLREAALFGVARESIEAASKICQTETYESMLKTVEKKIFDTEGTVTSLKKLASCVGVNPDGIPAYVLSRCWKDGKIKYPVRIICGKQCCVLLENDRVKWRKVTQSLMKEAFQLEVNMFKVQDNNLTEEKKGDI